MVSYLMCRMFKPSLSHPNTQGLTLLPKVIPSNSIGFLVGVKINHCTSVHILLCTFCKCEMDISARFVILWFDMTLTNSKYKC